MRKDADGAMRWLEKLPDGNEKENLIQCAANFTYDPAISLELATLIPEGNSQDAALMNATLSWISFDPAAALNWATTQAEGHARQMTLKVGAAEWLASDRKSASEWLTSIPASPEKDAMLSDAVQIVAKGMQVGRVRWPASIDRMPMPSEGYRDMAQLIGSIGDPLRGDAAYENLTNSWLRKDPDGARAWLTQSNLSLSLKNRLLQRPAAGPTK